jgi:hypothetical protein
MAYSVEPLYFTQNHFVPNKKRLFQNSGTALMGSAGGTRTAVGGSP